MWILTCENFQVSSVPSLPSPLTCSTMATQLIVLALTGVSHSIPVTTVASRWDGQKAEFQEAVNALRSGAALDKTVENPEGKMDWEYSSKSRLFEDALEQACY